MNVTMTIKNNNNHNCSSIMKMMHDYAKFEVVLNLDRKKRLVEMRI